MIFSSSIFTMYFLPVVLIAGILLDRKFRNVFLLLASLFFYAWGAPVFVFVVAGSVIADFFILREMAVSEKVKKKTLFWLSVILNLGLLLYFKYMNFFVDQVHDIAGWFGVKPGEWVRIGLPVGISFITFQKLAYTFDVSRKTIKPFRKIQDYALYIFMFPQLLSGPIVRPGQIAPQITGSTGPDTINEKLTGFYRFAIGLAKKVLIADALATTVNQIFSTVPSDLSTGLAWAGAIGYTFQIYFDFSGYTDMAIGIARMLGFRLPENFNSPYVSGSITEFWRRWHMTLSSWFRDYVFLPVAYSVSRKMPKERYIGLKADKVIYLIATSVTFLLCGFWHGAAWTFILWGAYQGVFLIIDRLFLLKFFKKTGRIPAVILTFMVTVIGWTMFRSDSLIYFKEYLHKMFSFTSGISDIWLNSKFWTMICLAAFFSFWGFFKKVGNWSEKLYSDPGNRTIILFTILAVLLFILSEAAITSTGFSPFIYFRF
ncbi:MAG: MBOAT family O-acyltransferase [Bacteroidota bacterium]|nr:MBOAT family O-acyltransferase [Bacteroidota bacterium]